MLAFMKLAIIVRESFASKGRRHGVHCIAPVASMVCGKFPKLQCQLRGAHAKVGLLILSCIKEFEFGSGDGTMEIAKTS